VSYEDEQYVSKMPKLMVVILLEQLLKIISKVHTASLKDESNSELCDELTEILHESEHLMHLLVAKHIVRDLANWPEELDLLQAEMEEYKLFWSEDLDDASGIVANAEMDLFLHSIGIKNSDEDE